MTRRTHTLLKDILLITIVIMVIVIVASSQSHGQQVNRDSGALLWGGTTGVSSGSAQSFIDLAGSLTNNFEVVASGTAASTLTTTVVGCMPGGTCSSTLTSSTGVASQLMTPSSSSGPYQTYKVTLSWTGGDATTAFRINRLGVMARLGGTGGGLPLGLTFAIPTLTVSTSGSGNGSVCLSGNTSGTACITAPAVAGTLTNPFALTNVLATADGSTAAAGYGFSGQTGVGMFRNGSNDLRLTTAADGTNHTTIALLDGTGIFVGTTAFFVATGANPIKASMASGVALGWTANNGSPSVASDVAFSRQGVNMLALGNGAANDETGLLRTGNTCRITTDIALTVNVASNICSYSLPAVAKAWAFRCDIQWAITAGSGTNTFALGVNPSQTPTGTTNAEAQVYTATAGTQTMGSTAISVSGATVILTGATYTPAATVQAAKISGTLLASGTTGTFAIQATANGTTATAAVKAGSACWLN